MTEDHANSGSAEHKQIKDRSAHDTAIALERLRIEEATASRAHELLVLDRQIELARIHAGGWHLT
ncbi:hypothetical protein PAXINDRAFT_173116 [Paxillus involutus ATCC 200175]|uniref:Uncharacterized protein n=1 Tax=Paxillus involutus ATCC 200175 TaxID=664439 RepID=A0A0C9SNJ6_PAXIN|nr:hypothetical protein PAXINDRAFT_173116 [Paxillus involutus ATCC 200175]